ncbi:lysophospholipid acyltransferase family protein [Eubacterium oxidoreducens]|uniref:1-acyl-sn-glycerol-3-phosphate acyltransferase n=1 Tax=Eubacterium oxidoreducens TaxID=1732 RepID=A0A1G6CDP6_EUBOX|nr:lysophospholipid acyltransferase family protein [Eubacterium oxidoreducens]SDB30872.1 1-acyl-sn-glycerol-3-phosphate acyltransferase [Eubacterium oxidoreducens]
MIRTIFGFLFAILFLVLAIPVLFIEWLLAKHNQEASDLRCLHFVQWAFRCILKICGVRQTIIGEEYLPTDEAVLFVGNHRSWFDILITYSHMKMRTGYVAKDSIESVPLLKNWMYRLHCLFMSRNDMKAALRCVLKGVDLLKHGISIFIFPEGTRGKGSDHILLPFHEGSFKMAEKAKCKVIPVAILGTREIFEAHLPYVKPCSVIVEYGKPIDLSELDKETKKHLGTYMQKTIQEMLIKNQSLCR